MIAVLLSGLLLGFAGSLHCVGMCGPLSLVLPTSQLSSTMKFMSLLLYQFGRMVMYSCLGLLFGFAGHGLYVAGFQQWFSIVLGVLVLAMAAFYFMQKNFLHLPVLSGFYLVVSKCIRKIVNSNAGMRSFFLLGMANGLLPCGMVYIALAATLSFHTLYEPVGFMAMFGAGTLPAMMLVAYSLQTFNLQLKRTIRRTIPFFIAAAGIVLILRGMNLGIPFISPQLPSAAALPINCHV